MENHVTSDVRFVSLATYANGFDADQARATLEQAGIPVLVKGPQVGIFGAAFQGTVQGGVELQVPSPELDHAKALLQD